MLRVLLIRHATPVPPAHHSDEYTRPLTDLGLQQAETLARELEAVQLDAVYSSPYLRAMQTVQPLAAARGLSVQPVEDLREHRLSSESINHWRDTLEQAWLDFDFLPYTGESMRETQTRAWAALESLAGKHSSGTSESTIALGGHGTAFSLLLHKLEPRVNAVFHLAMPMPAVYALEFDDTWRIASGPGINDF